MTSNDNLLEVKNLTINYATDEFTVHAVEDLSISIGKGKTLGCVGETGAGKTTTARAIMGLLGNTPAQILSGKILLNGEDLFTLSEKEMRSVRGDKISMIFQDPMTALNPIMTVGDQIAEVLLLHQTSDKQAATKMAGDMLELVGIDRSRLCDYPHQFSGGMKQRVVIAMALSCKPQLLIADEPTTALDVTIQAQVLELMKTLKDEYKTSMLMITHDLGIVAEICDYVSIMYAGAVLEYGSTEQIFTRPMHPYTQGLFACIPDINSEDSKLIPIVGLMPDPSNLPSGCRFHPRCPHMTANCSLETPAYIEVESGHFIRCNRQHETGYEMDRGK